MIETSAKRYAARSPVPQPFTYNFYALLHIAMMRFNVLTSNIRNKLLKTKSLKIQHQANLVLLQTTSKPLCS